MNTSNANAYGRAFEYSMAKVLHEKLQPSTLVDSSALERAKYHYDTLDENTKNSFDKAALEAVDPLLTYEKKLQNLNLASPLYISMQADRRGMVGDCRDILLEMPDQHWTIGVSCKHNHYAVKHSRLSPTINFGEKWVGIPCSQEYLDKIKSILESDTLKEMRKAKKDWSDIENKEEMVYKPVVDAFIDELTRIVEGNPDANVPAKLIKYLVGEYDFYKVFAEDKNLSTEVRAFNLAGTLGLEDKPAKKTAKKSSSKKPAKKVAQKTRVPKIKLPTKVLDIERKNDSTFYVYFDKGWQLKFRIHSASSRIQKSLKFDIQLVGVPANILSLTQKW